MLAANKQNIKVQVAMVQIEIINRYIRLGRIKFLKLPGMVLFFFDTKLLSHYAKCIVIKPKIQEYIHNKLDKQRLSCDT